MGKRDDSHVAKYWGEIAVEAWRQIASGMSWNTPKLLILIVPAVLTLAVTWRMKKEFAISAAMAIACAAILVSVWMLHGLIVVPARREQVLRRKLVPLPSADTPLFEVTGCSTNWQPESGVREEAYAILTYKKDLSGASLKVWEYQGGPEPVLIEAHTHVAQVSGHRHTLRLATVPEQSTNTAPFWGRRSDLTLQAERPALIVIEMAEGNIRQEYRVLLQFTPRSGGSQLTVTSPEWNPYFWPDRTGKLGAEAAR